MTPSLRRSPRKNRQCLADDIASTRTTRAAAASPFLNAFLWRLRRRARVRLRGRARASQPGARGTAVLPALASVTPPRSARTRSTSPPPSNPSPSRRNARRERWTAAIRSTPRAWLAPALGGASLPCGRGVEPPRAKRPSAESAQPTTPNMLAANQAKTTAPSPHRPRCCILDTIPFVAPCTREGGNPVVPGVSNAAWCGVALQWAGEVAGGGELRERSPKFAYGASVALAKSRASGVAWWTGLGAPFPELQESAFRSVSSATRVSAGGATPWHPPPAPRAPPHDPWINDRRHSS
jgi:hypothetical protein